MSEAAGASSLSVLVMDGSAPVLALISRILEGNGIRALLARNAAEALAIASRVFLSIDLLLVGGDGVNSWALDAVAAIRNVRPEVRVLGMSAVEEDGVIQLSLHGADRNAGLAESIRAACGVQGNSNKTRTAGHQLF